MSISNIHLFFKYAFVQYIFPFQVEARWILVQFPTFGCQPQSFICSFIRSLARSASAPAQSVSYMSFVSKKKWILTCFEGFPSRMKMMTWFMYDKVFVYIDSSSSTWHQRWPPCHLHLVITGGDVGVMLSFWFWNLRNKMLCKKESFLQQPSVFTNLSGVLKHLANSSLN